MSTFYITYLFCILYLLSEYADLSIVFYVCLSLQSSLHLCQYIFTVFEECEQWYLLAALTVESVLIVAVNKSVNSRRGSRRRDGASIVATSLQCRSHGIGPSDRRWRRRHDRGPISATWPPSAGYTFPPLILKFPLEFWMKWGRLPPLSTWPVSAGYKSMPVKVCSSPSSMPGHQPSTQYYRTWCHVKW